MTGWTTMAVVRNAIVMCALMAGCSAGAAAPETTDVRATTTPPTEVVATSTTKPRVTSPPTSTTLPRPLLYVFPFTGKKVSYGRRHSGYPATDVFGCGANVIAPIGGTIKEIRTTDPWDPKVNDPATRGGKYVSMTGDDGVRYYFAHLDSVAVKPGDVIDGGTQLGVMGQTGDARNTVCHTHVGISWPCGNTEWAVRRGEIWPWKYLDAWRKGDQLSPVDEIAAAQAKNPDACNLAELAPSAGEA
jgi:murein DD-endopeptidase MepM/ murein hydrolase activator NlpD